MTEQEIIEGNKLIALFMGYKETIVHTLSGKPSYPAIQFEYEHIAVSNLAYEGKYHTSWDSLIPVYKKLKGILKQLNTDESSYFSDRLSNALLRVDISLLQEVIVDVIKWYNQQ